MTRNRASFRDPSGFVFYRDSEIFRQVNSCCKADYDRFMESGLYGRLRDENLIVPHEQVDVRPEEPSLSYKVIRPRKIPFVSYPYEWSFTQLRQAALLTVNIQKIAMQYGMSLKDASAYNVQFVGTRPVFIDTLSFERYSEGEPWPAYRQFCQHFLAPLALAGLNDPLYIKLFRVHMDGIPLDFASREISMKSWFNPGLLTHLHIHSRGQKVFSGKTAAVRKNKMSRYCFSALLESLCSCISHIKAPRGHSQWSDYYQIHNYSEKAMEDKKNFISEAADSAGTGLVWDMGANDGLFSRLLSGRAEYVVSFDMDFNAVEKNISDCRQLKDGNVLPLVMDFCNPSPAAGWLNNERDSLLSRGPADTVAALAFIHHLVIGNNLSLLQVAELFAGICRQNLIVEFVPKEDSQVKRMLSSRKDIFADYSQGSFKESFGHFFSIERERQLRNSLRTVYYMKRRS